MEHRGFLDGQGRGESGWWVGWWGGMCDSGVCIPLRKTHLVWPVEVGEVILPGIGFPCVDRAQGAIACRRDSNRRRGYLTLWEVDSCDATFLTVGGDVAGFSGY